MRVDEIDQLEHSERSRPCGGRGEVRDERAQPTDRLRRYTVRVRLAEPPVEREVRSAAGGADARGALEHVDGRAVAERGRSAGEHEAQLFAALDLAIEQHRDMQRRVAYTAEPTRRAIDHPA